MESNCLAWVIQRIRNEDFIDYINKILNNEVPSTVEEGYNVAKERDLLLIGKQLKEVYENVQSL